MVWRDGISKADFLTFFSLSLNLTNPWAAITVVFIFSAIFLRYEKFSLFQSNMVVNKRVFYNEKFYAAYSGFKKTIVRKTESRTWVVFNVFYVGLLLKQWKVKNCDGITANKRSFEVISLTKFDASIKGDRNV